MGATRISDAAKRIFDVLIAFTALVALSPVLIIVASAVRLFLGKPVLYRQRRPGAGTKPFTLVKFRTMTCDRLPDGRFAPDERRLTRFGRWLRSTSLDELPELFNVLKGDMSLVGPRPLLMHYLPKYSPRQQKRHLVRPGITGWAQVNGRNGITWQEKLEMDIWYVENHNFALDAKILWMTFSTVLRREGISEVGSATMSEFSGEDCDADSNSDRQ